jgi:hypothetical protein
MSKVKHRYSVEMAKDLKDFYGIDIQEEMIQSIEIQSIEEAEAFEVLRSRDDKRSNIQQGQSGSTGASS